MRKFYCDSCKKELTLEESDNPVKLSCEAAIFWRGDLCRGCRTAAIKLLTGAQQVKQTDSR